MPSLDPRDVLLDEVAALVRVDPSPAFAARVRRRVAAQQMERRLPPVLLLLPATAAIVLSVALGLPNDAPIPERRADIALRLPTAAVAPPVAAAVAVAVAPRPARRSQPFPLARPKDVIISPDEARAIELLMTSLRDGRLDPASVPDFSNVLKPSIDIMSAALEPIRLEPLSDIPPLEEGTP
jgi:hypothetical protein